MSAPAAVALASAEIVPELSALRSTLPTAKPRWPMPTAVAAAEASLPLKAAVAVTAMLPEEEFVAWAMASPPLSTTCPMP